MRPGSSCKRRCQVQGSPGENDGNALRKEGTHVPIVMTETGRSGHPVYNHCSTRSTTPSRSWVTQAARSRVMQRLSKCDRGYQVRRDLRGCSAKIVLARQKYTMWVSIQFPKSPSFEFDHPPSGPVPRTSNSSGAGLWGDLNGVGQSQVTLRTVERTLTQAIAARLHPRGGYLGAEPLHPANNSSPSRGVITRLRTPRAGAGCPVP